MEPNEPLQQRTSKAAIRLLKSRLREFIYTTKKAEVTAAGVEDQRWGPLLLVEQSYVGPTLKEWQGVLTLWGDLSSEGTREGIGKILTEAFPKAASEVLTIFDEPDTWEVRKIIDQYHRNLQVGDFLVVT